ncbi:hypothetical protein PPGU19_092460 (plasmid) [Paraburkholderia sp. PGU19]|uniref:hypothetical protein n=1 Tax=Paraburkholderia sp. PGU19 TaxID=2735434 RepID=UPI0015DADFD4|nr:hypothetical protein [Paraburkholderia sp. PGU19]BCG04678.1 hypothetical protein PPGU19_092460 [Paraburkholderia sp. PGU19]
MLQEKVWVVDEAKLSEKLVKALEQGKAVIHDGVAYWAEGSGNSGIIQHLPFKETSIKGVEEAIKLAQATTVIVSAVSTGLILGAIVVQTRYLAAKLDAIQRDVKKINRELEAQNVVTYMQVIAEYFGQVGYAQTLLSDRTLADEIREAAIQLSTMLGATRNKLLVLIRDILDFAATSNTVSPEHFKLIVNFVGASLHAMPSGVYLEYLLNARAGKLRLAEKVLTDGSDQFKAAREQYRSFMNGLHKSMVQGKIGSRAGAYAELAPQAKMLLENDEGAMLLTLPTARVAIAA